MPLQDILCASYVHGNTVFLLCSSHAVDEKLPLSSDQGNYNFLCKQIYEG